MNDWKDGWSKQNEEANLHMLEFSLSKLAS